LDWSVAQGSEEFNALVTSMRQALIEMKFEPDYGRDVFDDVQRILTTRGAREGYAIHQIREAIPAQDLHDKKAIIKQNADSVMGALLASQSYADAEKMRLQLAAVLQSTDDNITLPDIVSVVFAQSDQYDDMQLPVQREDAQTALDDNAADSEGRSNTLAEQIVLRLNPSDNNAELREQACAFWARVYERARYIIPDKMTRDQLREATDPSEILSRTDILVAMNEHGQMRRTARLIYPNSTGIKSLPTGSKLLETYGSSLLPADADSYNVGEIGSFASLSRSAFETVELVSKVIEAAIQADMKYVLFGAVSGGPSEHFKHLFGPAVHTLQINGGPAVVVVKGPGYREEGIELEAAYLSTADFFTDVKEHYMSHRDQDAEQIINMCSLLQSKQGVLR